MTRRVVSGVFLTLLTTLAALIALAVLLFSQLPDWTGFDVQPGHGYQQRHNGQGRG
jgi:hypothetical protein